MITKLADFVNTVVDYHDLEKDVKGTGIILEVFSDSIVLKLDTTEGRTIFRPHALISFGEHI